jgi:hypothetical protein
MDPLLAFLFAYARDLISETLLLSLPLTCKNRRVWDIKLLAGTFSLLIRREMGGKSLAV